jgi:hypothetical protein
MPIVRLIAALLIAAFVSTVANAAEPAEQFVALRNGNLLRGTVGRVGDHWRVISAGTELYLRSAEVDFQCDSIDAAYSQYRARLTTPTAADRMQLAAWCLRHELWTAAKTELNAARMLEPNHPRLAVLEQTADHLQKMAQSQPRESSPPVETAPESPEQAAPFDGIATDLPAGALEDFTRRVQPILVNNCTTSGCHRIDGPQRFQLNRDLLHGMANRRSTMRNLAATLNLVNKDIPLESELLTQAKIAHAGMEISPLPAHRDLHKRLEDWVWLVSGKQPLAREPAAGIVQLGAIDPSGGVVPASATNVPTSDGDITSANIDEAAASPLAPKRPRVGVQLKSWTPQDEFDPEIFNRRRGIAAEPTAAQGAEK